MKKSFTKAAAALTMAGTVMIAGHAHASIGRDGGRSEKNTEEYIVEEVPGQNVEVCYISGNKGLLIEESGRMSLWTVGSDDVTRMLRNDIDITVEIMPAIDHVNQIMYYYPLGGAAEKYIDNTDNQRLLYVSAALMVQACRDKLNIFVPFGLAAPQKPVSRYQMLPNLLDFYKPKH